MFPKFDYITFELNIKLLKHMSSFLDKNKILDASRAVFAKHGFRKASLADIARPLGVAKTALYHYFPEGKRELIHAVMQREEDTILLEMQKAKAAHTDPRGQLRALIVSKLTHFHFLRELYEVPVDVGEEIYQIYNSHKTAFHDSETNLIKDILTNGQMTGLFRLGDAARTASHIRMVLHHMELSFVFDKNRQEMERDIDALLEILFYGIVNLQNQSSETR